MKQETKTAISNITIASKKAPMTYDEHVAVDKAITHIVSEIQNATQEIENLQSLNKNLVAELEALKGDKK